MIAPAGRDSPVHRLQTVDTASQLFTHTLAAHIDIETAARVSRICARKTGSPLGYGHIGALCELSNVTIAPDTLRSIEVAYTLSVGQAFIVDDLSDGQSASDDARFLGTMRSLEVAVLAKALPSSTSQDVLQLVLHGGIEQLAALDSERTYWRNWRTASEDPQHVIGRSNTVLTYLRIIEQVSGQHISAFIVQSVSEFLRLVQYCDDISDWEDDLRSGHVTPVIANRLIRRGFDAVDDSAHQMLIRDLYLEKGLLFELKSVIFELESLKSSVLDYNDKATKFTDFIDTMVSVARRNIQVIDDAARR